MDNLRELLAHGLIFTLAVALSACEPHLPVRSAGEDKTAAPDTTQTEAWYGPAATLSRQVQQYDGQDDDLLTAGLGFAGLLAASPAIADPAQPTAAELRRLALYHAYRGLIDLRPEGALAQWRRADGQTALAPVAGSEILLLRQIPQQRHAANVLLQIPERFNWQQPCLVATATSGSRGIYGAVPVIAHWALPRGCAVVYSEKGTGNGIYLPASEQGYAFSGELVSVYQAAFDPRPEDDVALTAHEAYQSQHPYRVAFRHAHSQDNPEAHWGTFLLDAVHVALHELNTRRSSGAPALTPENTLIIASGISNGGGAALKAVEIDDRGVFDGVVVAEPNVQVPGAPSLYDSSTQANLYAACAVQGIDPTTHPLAAVLAFQAPLFNARCQHLERAGLLDGTLDTPLAQQALNKMHAAGYPPSADPLLAFAVAYDLYPAISATYAHAYGRFPFHQPPCAVGFAFTTQDGRAQALPQTVAASLFALSSGVPPTAGIQLVRADAQGKDRKAALVPGYATQPDGDLAAALCHRRLSGAVAAPVALQAAAERVVQGIAAIRHSADLRGRPAFIVHGAADNVVPVAHSSRAYVRLNRQVEGEASRLHYTEIENGQHFDALLALPAYQDRYEGLHGYFLRDLERLWETLSAGL